MTRTEAEQQYRDASLAYHVAWLRYQHAETQVYAARGCRYAERGNRSIAMKRQHVQNRLAQIDAETHRQALQEVPEWLA